jgi:NADP-dependent 3-hydroxy acid dehydrogenase YdfG
MITGCSSGIGRAAVEVLTARGHDVVATARNLDALQDLKAQQKLQLDVTDVKSVAAAVAAAGEIDALVNNAGFSMWGPLERNSITEVERLFDTNVLGALRMSQAVLPGMRARKRGVIIQISSGAARRPQPMVGAYAATKAALASFSMSMRIELHGSGVRVCIIEMGAIRSEIDRNRVLDDARGSYYEEMAARMIARTQKLRSQAREPEEVAAVIASLVEQPDPPFRSYVGKDFAEKLEAMAALSDADFEAQVYNNLYSN